MIDFHCHLDLYPSPSSVVAECRERGLYVLSVTTTPSAWPQTSALPKNVSRIRTALGLHPQLARERKTELRLFDQFLPDTRYVGEIGLDAAPEFQEGWAAQIEVFDHILQACCRAGGRILSIHSRRAATAVLDRLENSPTAGTPVLHWFSGNIRELERAIELGCWFSVGPAMLVSDKGRSLVRRMPRQHVLTETDGPFAQSRGRALMPWDVKDAIPTLGQIWGLAIDETQRLLDDNLRALVTSAEDSAD